MSSSTRRRPEPLARAFHEQPVVELARALIGQRLVRRVGRGARWIAGRIVEVEAYGGEGVDPSAHSYRGPTPRCEVMFGPAGHAYVYATQGRCSCVNVTAQGDAGGKAVLLRAVEPQVGHDTMRERRLARLGDGPTRRALLAGKDHELARGPGRLCLAFDVDRTLNAVDLTDGEGPLYLAAPTGPDAASAPEPERTVVVPRVSWSPRVGLNPASASFGWTWRAYDRDSAAVSAAPEEHFRARRGPAPRVCPAPKG